MPKIGKVVLIGTADRLLAYARSEAERVRIGDKYGWLSGSDYRPSVVADNVSNAISKPDEYFPFVFRHLSATIVGGGSWKATEFPALVLKAAASLLTNKPVFVNHELEISNLVGVNGNIEFVGGYKAEDGTDIPAGLEGPIWIDGLLHQDLTRKLSAFPVPHIQSVSVTVSYNWEPSHTFKNRDGQEDDWAFEMQIGSMVDGKMVRRVATEILDFVETSFVYLGADPFAKIIDAKGDPLNVEKSAIVGKSEFSKDPLMQLYKDESIMYIMEDDVNSKNLLYLKERINNSFSKSGKFSNQHSNTTNMDKLLAAFAKKMGKEVSELSVEMIADFMFLPTAEHATLVQADKDFKALKPLNEKAVADLASAQTALSKFESICKTTELDALNTDIPFADVIGFAKLGKASMVAKKEEVIRLYKITLKADEKADDAILATFDKADDAALTAFIKQYGGTVVGQFAGHCKDCGSDKINYRSSQEDEQPVKVEVGRESMADRKRR
jgi:hypothetical protein